jgi:hypothetical protein
MERASPMSVHRRDAKRDANEPAIAKAMVQVGASVTRLSAEGVPDLLVGFRGCTYLLEVKVPGGTLTEAQETFIKHWNGLPVGIVRTPEEALIFIGAIDP